MINVIECFTEVGVDKASFLIIFKGFNTCSRKFVCVDFPLQSPCWELDSGEEIKNVIWIVMNTLKSLGTAIPL